MYDAVFRLQLPLGCIIVGFEDDIIIVLVANTVSEIEEKANTWFEQYDPGQACLSLTAHKMEAVSISSRKIVDKIVQDFTIELKRAISNLG